MVTTPPFLVERLWALVEWKRAPYDKLTASNVRDYDSQPYVEEFARPNDNPWHLGRVRYFFDQLQAGKKLDPICVDNMCDAGHIYAVPVIIDGCHRLVASHLAGARTIAASYGGRVDLRDYLTGLREALPSY